MPGSRPGDESYPPALRRAIINHNLPILRGIVPSYRDNLEKSLARRDLVFINNEVTWLLVAYFDILFALNNVPHPGAKRLLEQVERLCPRRPPDLPAQVGELLHAWPPPAMPPPARARPPGR